MPEQRAALLLMSNDIMYRNLGGEIVEYRSCTIYHLAMLAPYWNQNKSLVLQRDACKFRLFTAPINSTDEVIGRVKSDALAAHALNNQQSMFSTQRALLN